MTPTSRMPSIAHGPAGCGAVAAGSRDTALAAAAVLRAGGNAVDAALGGMLAAAVSEVVFTSLGGGGFMLIRRPGEPATVLDFFTNTPGLHGAPGTEPPHFAPITVRFLGTEQVFHAGPGSVAVPGALAGVLHASREYGRIPLAGVVAPAIRLARHGAVLEPVQADVLDLVAEIMRLTEPCAALIANPDGTEVRPGDLLVNPDYAAFLERLGAGEIGDLTSAPFAEPMRALMRATNGHVTDADLAGYRVIERAPIEVARGGAHVALNAPPAFGGVIIADALRRLPAITDTPRGWAAVVTALREATEANRVADLAAGVPHATRGTTHLTVVDGDGVMVSMTTSNGSGSGVLLPGTGIHLNNMMGEEDLNPAGFHALPPGLRMGSMMAPMIITGADGTVTGLGTGGSERIRSSLLATVLRLLDLGESPDAAVAAPRLHPTPEAVQFEPGWDPAITDRLGEREPVNIWPAPDLYFGGVHAVTRHANGTVTAVGDSRRGGAAVVVPL